MVLNELLAKQNLLNTLLIKDGENELSKELKVKIVRLRIAYNKVKKQFDEDQKEFTKDLIPEELTQLQSKESRTEDEEKKMNELINKVNSEYNEFITQKTAEDVDFKVDDTFSEEDFDEIVSVNAGNEVEINNIKVKAEELMESFYTLFVNKN